MPYKYECSFDLLIYLLSFRLLENLKWFCNLKSQGKLPNWKLPRKIKHLGLKQKLIYSSGSQVLSTARNPGISWELDRNASSQPTPDLHWKPWVGPETCLVTNHSNVIKHSKDSDAHTSEKHCPKGREGTPADASNKPSGSIRTRQESLRPFSCALMNTVMS